MGDILNARALSGLPVLAAMVLGWASILPGAAALEVREGYVRGLPPGQSTSAAFFRLVNPEPRPWTLERVETEVAERVEIHRHEHREGMMRMRELPSLTVDAESEQRFSPGALHLMLIGLKRPLREGEKVELRFFSETGESVTQSLPVISVLNERRLHHNQ